MYINHYIVIVVLSLTCIRYINQSYASRNTCVHQRYM